METLSFVLGIAFVVVIAVAVVAVYAFVKVNKLEEQLEENRRDYIQDIERVYRNQSDEYRAVYDHISSTVRGIEAQLDSRLDKLQNKKQLLKD